MSHSTTKVWIHGVFSTKDRAPLIDVSLEKKLFEHIKERLEKDYDCRVKVINGSLEHIHILFLLDQKHSVFEIFKNIKGESSHWINQSGMTKEKFCWQTGYGAFSVSDSMTGDVVKYILNQKAHHKKMSYTEEVNLFLKKYGIEKNNFLNR